jgi:hypothetical protein
MTPAQRRRRRRAQERTTEPQREFSPSNPPAADSLGARIDNSAIAFRDLTDRVAEMKEQQELTAEAVEELTRLINRLITLNEVRDMSPRQRSAELDRRTAQEYEFKRINLENPLNL